MKEQDRMLKLKHKGKRTTNRTKECIAPRKRNELENIQITNKSKRHASKQEVGSQSNMIVGEKIEQKINKVMQKYLGISLL